MRPDVLRKQAILDQMKDWAAGAGDWAAGAGESVSDAIKGLPDATYDDVSNVMSKITGSNPLMAAGITGTGLGLLGYQYGPKLQMMLDSLMSRTLGRFAGEPTQFRSMADVNSAKRRMGLTGAALGVAPWVIPMIDAYQSGDLMGDYSKKGSADVPAPESPEKMAKRAASNYVDADFARQMVDEDPHIPAAETQMVTNIFDEAQRRAPESGRLQGLLTGSDIARGAVGAGLGYGTAALAAPVFQGIFGMPRGTQRKLKRTGGLAGALIGSGIIGDTA